MQDWISVKDRLPTNYQNVLFITTEDKQVYPGYFVAAPARNEESNFLGVFRIGYYSKKTLDLLTTTYNVWANNQADVSHWQPFPQAPMDDAGS